MKVFLLAMSALGLTGLATAQEAIEPVGPGSLLTYAILSESEQVDTMHAVVIGERGPWNVFMRYTASGETGYYAEAVSSVFDSDCVSYEEPSDLALEAFAARLADAEVGDQVVFADDLVLEYVEVLDEFFYSDPNLSEMSSPAREFLFKFEGDDEALRYTVAEDLKLVLAIDWGGGAEDRLISIRTLDEDEYRPDGEDELRLACPTVFH